MLVRGSALLLAVCLLGTLSHAASTEQPPDGDGEEEAPPPIYFKVQFESGSVIPDDCQNELLLPTSALTGNIVDWDYMCGTLYYDRCFQVLKYIFLLEYTNDEIEFITGLFRSITTTGSNFTCTRTAEAVQAIMDKGGAACIADNKTALDYCSYVSILKFSSGYQIENVCKSLEYAFECNMFTISDCENNELKELWEGYYRAIVKTSPCNKFSKYGSGAIINKNNINLTLLLLATALTLYYL